MTEYKDIEKMEKILREYGILLVRKGGHFTIKIPRPDKVTYNPLAPVKPPKDFMEFILAVGYLKSYIPQVQVYKLKVPEEEMLG